MNKILLIFIVWAFGITANAAEVTIEMLNKLDGRSMVFSEEKPLSRSNAIPYFRGRFFIW